MAVIYYANPPSPCSFTRRGLVAAANDIPYSVKLVNQSADPWTFFSYQQVSNEQSANLLSLVWICSPFQIVPKADITFQWSIDYNFVWGACGNVQPGVTFSAGEAIPADPQSGNNTIFSTLPGPNLSAAAPGSPQGSLAITDASTVPNNTFLVGIGMGGAGTIVTLAGPNLRHTFTTSPTYWIAAGVNIEVGTILDITTVAQNLQVNFPVNVYDITCVLGADNQGHKARSNQAPSSGTRRSGSKGRSVGDGCLPRVRV